VAEQGLAMLAVGGGLYLVGVATPDVGIGLNIVSAIGGQKRPGRELRLHQCQA
jgi:hypothetical protein